MKLYQRTTLTTREQQIIKLLADEYSSKQIADELHISFDTVKSHRKNIQQKLGVKNVAGVVRVAFQRRILHVKQEYKWMRKTINKSYTMKSLIVLLPFFFMFTINPFAQVSTSR